MQKSKRNYLRRTTSLLMAMIMIASCFSQIVLAEEEPKMGMTSVQSVADKAFFEYKDTSKELNWEDQISNQDFYWPLDTGQTLRRVTYTDPVNISSLDFNGYYINEEGRTVLRLVYNFYAAAASGVWRTTHFRFDKNLYNKIDWNKSGVKRSDGTEILPFATVNRPYEKKILNPGSKGIINDTYASRSNYLPVELVLNDGVDIESLGKSTYFVQSRLVSEDDKFVYAYAPKGSSADYTTYTFTTPVVVGDRDFNLFLPGGLNDDEYVRSQVRGRSFTAEYDPSYDAKKNLGKLSLQYLFRHSKLSDNIQTDSRGKRPYAFVISFDKRIAELLPKDQDNPSQTIVGNTQAKDSNKRPRGTTQAIKRENIFVKGNVAYIMIVNDRHPSHQTYNIANIDSSTENPNEAGFVKASPIVVSSLTNKVYANIATDFATFDLYIDNKKASDAVGEDENPMDITNFENYVISSGLVVPNAEGWNEYSYEFIEDFTIPDGGNFQFLMSKEVPGRLHTVHATIEKPNIDTKTIMMDRIGYRHDVSWYTWGGLGGKTKSGHEAMSDPKDNGEIQQLNFLGGRQIKKGDILRVLVQNPGYTGIPLFITDINWNTVGQADGDGGYELEIKDDYYVHGRLTRAGAAGAPKQAKTATFTYTPAEYDETKPEVPDNPQTKVVNITREGTFQSSDDSVFAFKNAVVIAGGTTFKIDMRKVKPGTKAVLKTELNNGTIKEAELETTGTVFKDHGKDYRPFYVNSSNILSMMSLRKAHYLPKQEIFTNDYTGIDMKTNTSGVEIVQGSGAGKDEGDDDDSGITEEVKSTFEYAKYKKLKEDLEKFNPLTENLDKFMTNAKQLRGYSRYNGGTVVNALFPQDVVNKANPKPSQNGKQVSDLALDHKLKEKGDKDHLGEIEIDMSSKVKAKDKNGAEHEYEAFMYALDTPTGVTLKKDMQVFLTNSEESSLYSKWKEERVRARVLFDKNTDQNFKVEAAPKDKDGNVTPNADHIVKIVPDNEKYIQDKDYKANGFSENSGAVLKDDYGKDLTGEALELRKWPEKPDPITVAGETKEFLGWATKQVTAEEFAELDTLTDVKEWAEATTTGYKVTEDSPFDSHQVLYAVYGDGISAVYNPEQKYDEAKDNQYIEAILKTGETAPTDPNTKYKLVQKDSDGNYKEIDVPVTKDGGKITFDVKNKNIVHDGEYYIAVTEPGKGTSYSDTAVKVDKQGPTLGTPGNEITLVQDAFGYQVKISANAKDDSGILRVYAEEDKDNGYYNKEAKEKTAKLNESIQKQGGTQKKFKVTAVDKFGNKTEATKDVSPKTKPLVIKAERPLSGDDFIYVKADKDVNLKIKVINRDKSEALSMNHTQKTATDKINLVNTDGSAFTLKKGQKVKINATKDGMSTNLTIRVR